MMLFVSGHSMCNSQIALDYPSNNSNVSSVIACIIRSTMSGTTVKVIDGDIKSI